MSFKKRIVRASTAAVAAGLIGTASIAPASAVDAMVENGHILVKLDPSEQGAGSVGLAGTIAGSICAATGAGSAGIGCAVGAGLAATTVGIATAHGACPDEKDLIIYPNGTKKTFCS